MVLLFINIQEIGSNNWSDIGADNVRYIENKHKGKEERDREERHEEIAKIGRRSHERKELYTNILNKLSLDENLVSIPKIT